MEGPVLRNQVLYHIADTEQVKLCRKSLYSRSKYALIESRLCHSHKGHDGRCDEFPYLKHIHKVAPKVAKKIVRDSVMTTGASWASDEAGPNRILRWVMLLEDKDLKSKFGINMAGLKPHVVAKLREKAATYSDCMEVALALTKAVYEMPGCPRPPADIQKYIETRLGKFKFDSTVCTICRSPLEFQLFDKARRGKAEIETSHTTPRQHNAKNVGFAHRRCNIAQGDMSLDEFYAWISGILTRLKSE